MADTGNAAPQSDLEVLRQFVNTVDLESAAPLDPGDSLPAWCEGPGNCAHIDEEGLARLRLFREALRSVLEAHAGEGDPAERLAALQPFAAGTRYELRITQDGSPVLQAHGDGAQAAVAKLLAIVYDAVAAGTFRRLKACRKHSCRWAFYDHSKNGSGAWCDMAVCGNRVKAQKRRARQKSP